MIMSNLILTVGLPRSGKSTWSMQQGYPVVNPDSVRLALHGQKFVIEAEPMVWSITRYMIKSLFIAGHETVILDATNTTERRRNEWKSKEWDTFYRYFDTSKDVCIERARSIDYEELVPVIERMDKQLEKLSSTEWSNLWV